jgi:hypothetical protein
MHRRSFLRNLLGDHAAERESQDVTVRQSRVAISNAPIAPPVRMQVNSTIVSIDT